MKWILAAGSICLKDLAWRLRQITADMKYVFVDSLSYAVRRSVSQGQKVENCDELPKAGNEL
jgi:hypothetical protein